MLKKIIISSLIIFLLFLFIDLPKSVEPIHLKTESEKSQFKDEYLAYLIIPKISMNLGFYNLNDERNTVDKNIELLSSSTSKMLLLAGHSGRGKYAYFNDLAKLKINDEIIIKYQNQEYIYVIKNINRQLKSGQIKVSNRDDYMVVLTTCDQVKKGYQLTIEAILKTN